MSEETTPTETTPTTPAAPVTPPTTPATPSPQVAQITSIDQIPQELRNQLESQHRKGLQTKITELTIQNEALSTLREQSAAFMDLAVANGIQFEEGSQLDTVSNQVMETLEGLQSEQERLTKANAKKAEEIKTQEELAGKLQAELFQTLIRNQLSLHLGQNDEGQPRTVSPKAAELIADELSKFATVADDRSITFEMDVVDSESDTKQKKKIDAKTAVATLEADSAWSSFFTATVNAGTGGEVTDGVQRAGNGEIDIEKLAKSEEGIRKFFDIMDKNPEIIDRAMNRIPR
jgi:DNA polymerase III gamma/tau subunit